MIVDILFVTAVVVLLIFIFRIKFSKESVDKEVEEAVLAREREIQARVIRT